MKIRKELVTCICFGWELAAYLCLGIPVKATSFVPYFGPGYTFPVQKNAS